MIIRALSFSILLSAIAAGKFADAAIEIRFMPECRCEQELVALGDVALIGAKTKEDELVAKSLPLFPAPLPGMKRRIDRQEIIEVLSLLGYGHGEVSISGAKTIVISRPRKVAKRAWAPISKQQHAKAEQYVQRAIEQLLDRRDQDGRRWQAELSLDESEARQVLFVGEKLAAEFAPNLDGRRDQFRVRSNNPGRDLDLLVVARASQLSGVVIAKRPIGRGDLIHADDVTLSFSATSDSSRSALQSVHDAVGHEATRSIPEQRVITESDVRRPILVNRGRVITIVAKNAGVKVMALARAREDGAAGDVIRVESLETRDTYLARVSGVNEAEVFAGATPIANSRPRAGANSNQLVAR